MKNQGIFRKLGDFVLGKGFYIVLFLCVATIGISGYYLITTMTGQPENSQQAGGDASVVLPDSEANGPDPAGTLLPEELEQPDSPIQDTTAPQEGEQPDDPEPVKQTEEETSTAAPPAPEEASYTWPAQGDILRDFSLDVLSPDPTLGDWRTHAGLDIAAEQGTQVLAMCAGTVTQVYTDGLMGTTVVLDHGNGLVTTYCGLSESADVEAGQAVDTGDVIGTVGNTAIAESGMASHLHVEAMLNGQLVSPLDYLPEQ